MFGIGFAELIVIMLVLIIFVRPEDLPRVLRTLGRNYAKSKKFYNEIIMVKDKMLKDIEAAANIMEDPSKTITKNITAPLKNAMTEAQTALMSVPKVIEAPKSPPEAATPEPIEAPAEPAEKREADAVL